MSTAQSREPVFRIREQAPSETVVAGFSSFGLAGLTAVDFLVDHLELEQTGHVAADQLPSITPFEAGTPRHHSRFFSRPDLDLTVFVNELFLPAWAAGPFADALLAWTETNDVEEIAILSGVPFAHGPDEHATFYVATEDYQARRLDGVDVDPMREGFLDGVNASLMSEGMDSSLRTGLFVTPVHAQVPDVEAAIRLIDAFERVYGFDVDSGPLEAFAREVEQYYRELSTRLADVEEQHVPEDRMYM
ncbi:proteasome assembly chaperone family protein [Salinirarus marinus]|uniref:proteasome assembly chaperone family protein n=1 Tax=Salinirarus marinus TaxID=3068310 RepID=UPI003C6C1A0D